jgi:gamma-glutamylaminecyclotransferase
MHHVFVYGTLKRGFPNYDNIGMGQYRYLGPFVTLQMYPLVVGGPWNSPCLINEPGDGHRVEGEVYVVNQEGIEVLDRLENVGRVDGYERLRIEVAGEGAGEPLSAWAYLKERARIGPIHSEALSNYELVANYPRYIPKWERP